MGVFCLAVGYEWLRRMERRLYLTTDVRASHGKPGGAAEDWLAFWEHREGPILRALVHALGICVGCHLRVSRAHALAEKNLETACLRLSLPSAQNVEMTDTSSCSWR